jgi:hypothetical protein
VRIVERGEHFSFALEAREPIGIGRDEPGSSFTATSRLRRVSRALYTSPIPPAPMGERIS